MQPGCSVVGIARTSAKVRKVTRAAQFNLPIDNSAGHTHWVEARAASRGARHGAPARGAEAAQHGPLEGAPAGARRPRPRGGGGAADCLPATDCRRGVAAAAAVGDGQRAVGGGGEDAPDARADRGRALQPARPAAPGALCQAAQPRGGRARARVPHAPHAGLAARLPARRQAGAGGRVDGGAPGRARLGRRLRLGAALQPVQVPRARHERHAQAGRLQALPLLRLALDGGEPCGAQTPFSFMQTTLRPLP